MTEKQQLIQAFKTLDFDALQNLLDDDRPYMDVSKSLFLSTLKQKIEHYKNLTSYEEVVEGICDHCNKGCKAYKFRAKNFPSLNLFFEEKDGKITDIYLCNRLKTENPDEYEGEIYFKFYKEEELNFKPTVEYLINLQKIEKAINDFNKLESMGLTPIAEVAHWFNSYHPLAIDLRLINFLRSTKYKAYKHFQSVYFKVKYILILFKQKEIAQNAYKEYNEMDKENERMIVSWLLKYKDFPRHYMKETKNWKKTGILILETEPNLVIDWTGYMESILLAELHLKHETEIMKKYEPTDEHFIQNGGTITVSLESFLKLHGKYLDLL